MKGITTAGSSFIKFTSVGTSMLVIEMTSHCTSIVKLLEIVIEEKFVSYVSNTTDVIPRSAGSVVTRVKLLPDIVRIEAGIKVGVIGPQ